MLRLDLLIPVPDMVGYMVPDVLLFLETGVYGHHRDNEAEKSRCEE